MSNTRVRTVFTTSLKERIRNHILMDLVLFLPIYFIALINLFAPDITMRVWIEVEGVTEILTVPMAETYTVLMMPMVCALVAGITGMFMMQSGEETDGRLLLVGYKSWEVVTSRLVIIGVIASLSTVAALVIMWFFFWPEMIAVFVLSMLIAGLSYGMLGVLVGSVLDSLSGMYVMLFAPLLDMFIFQNPMIVRGDPDPWMTFLPGYLPVSIAYDAAYTNTVPTAEIGWAVVYLGILVGLATLAFRHATRINQ